MAIKRSSGKRAGRALALWLCLVPGIALSAAEELTVTPVTAGPLAADPRSTATVVFRVTNGGAKARDLSGRLDLPEGWKPIFAETPFHLDAGSDAVRLVSVIVPVDALAGVYPIGYEVAAQGDPGLKARAEAEIRVNLQARLSLTAKEPPPAAIAGDLGTYSFLVLNQGNAPLDVRLAVKSNGHEVRLETEQVRIEAGCSRAVKVEVLSDRGLRRKLIQHVELTASAIDPLGQGLGAQALTQQEIIPRVYGQVDGYNRIPLEIGFVALSTGTGTMMTQITVSGSGALDESGRRTVEVGIRGPGRDHFNLFGYQREEYRLRYESPNLGLSAGDKVFALTNLTNHGEYGRGAEARLDFGPWMIKAYGDRRLFVGQLDSERALQLGFQAAEALSLKLSFLSESRPSRPDSRIFSLQSRYVSRPATVTLEAAWDRTSSAPLQAANSALWLESSGGISIASYRVNVIRSGANFGGYYQNLDFRSGELTILPSSKLQVRASYLDQRRATAILPYFPPFYDQTIQAGLQYQANRWLNLSLDQRIHDRRDLSLESAFSYRDSTMRAGAAANIGPLSLQAAFDFGRTLNELNRQSEKLAEYTFSASTALAGRLILGGYVHYRDQDEAFTGNGERQLDLNFSAGYQSGRTHLEAFYRTAIRQSLYGTALSERSFEDPLFLLNNFDLFGVSLSQRFGNGHQLSLRLQRATDAVISGAAGNRMISLLEYSIPLGLPVGRKASIGALRGRIFDAENTGRGLEGVIVRVNDMAVLTGKGGEYVFNGLEPGRYILSLEGLGAGLNKIPMRRTPLEVSVAGGRNSDVSIGLVSGSALSGRIMVYKADRSEASQMIKTGSGAGPLAAEAAAGTESSGAKPGFVESRGLVSALVELTGPDDEVQHARTDEAGSFLFDGLRPGKYTLRAMGDGLPELHVFEQDAFAVDLAPGAQAEVRFKVLPVIRSIQIIQQTEATVVRKDPVR